MGLPNIPDAYSYIEEKLRKTAEEYELGYDDKMWILLRLLYSCHVQHVAKSYIEEEQDEPKG